MRFVCQHCDAKYTIADEKVSGKVLRVRCKQCGTIIEVRDPASAKSLAPPSPTSQKKSRPSAPAPRDGKIAKAPPPPGGKSVLEGKFASAFKPAGAGKPGPATPGLYDTVKRSAQAIGKRDVDLAHWFAAVDGAPEGPISARRVQQYQKAGKINDDSMVWKEGMPDWVALRNCKELVGLVARIDLEDSVSLDPGGDPVPRLGLFGAQTARQDTSPLKGYSTGVIGERKPEEPAEDDCTTQANYRLDQLFPSPGATSTAGTGRLTEDSAAQSFFGAEDEPDTSLNPVSAVLIHSLSPPGAAGQSRIVMISAIGLFLVALVLLVVMLGAPGEPGERIVTQTVEKVVEKVVYRDRPLSPDLPVEDDAGGGDSSKAKAKDKARAVASDKTNPAKATAIDEKTKALMAQMGMDAGAGGPIGADRQKRGADSAGAAAPALSAPQIKHVVDTNKGALQNCYVRSLKQGDAPSDKDIRINFNLTVGTSGMVKNINLSGEGSNNANLKSCLTRAIKKWMFPAAKSESPVEFPILFSPR